MVLNKALVLDKALDLDKELDLDKALDLWIVNLIQQASSSIPTVRCWVVSWSDNHEGKHLTLRYVSQYLQEMKR